MRMTVSGLVAERAGCSPAVPARFSKMAAARPPARTSPPWAGRPGSSIGTASCMSRRSADVATIQAAIARQVKSSLGALREVGIGIEDRGALHNLDPAGWMRDTLDGRRRQRRTPPAACCACAITTATRRWCRRGTTRARRSASRMLFGDYAAGAAALAAGVRRRSHRRRFALVPLLAGTVGVPLAHQRRDVDDQPRPVDAAAVASPQIPASDAKRRFVGVRGKLTPIAAAPTEVSRVRPAVGLRLGSRRSSWSTRSSASSRTSATRTTSAPSNISACCARCAAKFPKLAVTYTQPHALLLDFYVDGTKLDSVTWDDVAHWMIDGTG